MRAVLLLVLISFVSVPLHEVDCAGYPLPTYTYHRLPEVRRQCAPFLPVVLAELKPEESQGERLKNELSFINGDWSQEPDAVPLIPSKNDQMQRSDFYPGKNVVSFWVMDVGSQLPSDNMASVSGILEIGFTATDELFSNKPSEWSSDFETSSELTKRRIPFEGVYVESDENGGERHMCLLGTSLRPDSDNVSMSHFRIDESSSGQNDQIILLLRYPKIFTLTSRGIYGQMESLATKSDLKYFGKVSVSSQLNERSSTYQFGSLQVLNFYNDSNIRFDGDSTSSRGIRFCEYLQALSWLTELKINLNHNSFVTDGLLGSFFLENQKIEDFNLGNYKLIIRNFICNPGYQGVNALKVAAEFTVLKRSSWTYPKGTSSMSGKSIFAEGIWNSSKREFHMLGCLGGNDNDPSTCDYQVSIYYPTDFSIHRRSTAYGSIKSINTHSVSDDMILLENVVSSSMKFVFWANFYEVYEYSKLSLASAFKSGRDLLASDLVSKLKGTLGKYPSYDPKNRTSLALLAGDLTHHLIRVPYSAAQFENCRKQVSLNLLFGSEHVHLYPSAETQANSDIRTVALYGYITLTGSCFGDVSVSVEGLYNPQTGTMHLIGCRDVRDIRVENTDSLEKGHDCLIEVEIEYPPMNARWLLKQKLKISISSQREKQDSLHFSPIIIWTQPITYPRQMAEEQFFQLYGIYLRFILLIVALFCVTYQLMYMSTAQGEASTGYISFVMLGIQVSSYALFFNTIWSFPSADRSVSSKVEPIDITIISSIFISISSEFIKIARKVWTRRTKLNPASDIKVLLITLTIHAIGLSVFLSDSMSYPTLKQMESYWSLVLDLFLLPQIISNRLWRNKSKPLRKIYYIGFSLIRALPHLFYFQYSWSDSDYTLSFTYTSRMSEVYIAMGVILLAIVVYIQQRCSIITSQPEPTVETENLEEEDISVSN